MDWGQSPTHLRVLVKKQRRLDEQGKGEVLPTIAALPDIPDHLRDHWRAFLELHRTRSVGFDGPGPITHAEMAAWFANNGIPLQERGEFVTVIQAMDKVWADYSNEKRQKGSQGAAS